MKIALLYEHPTWSAELIDRIGERGIEVTTFDVGDPDLASADDHVAHDVWINRVNAMPSAGRTPSVVAATGHLLLSLELGGQRVINGSFTHRIGGSKNAQAALFALCDLATPASVAIHRAEQAAVAAERVGFPVVTKPNVGGSGSGIVRYDGVGELAAASATGQIDLGIDGTGIVQQVIESADGLVHRIEMLGSALFYATRQPIQAGTFNYCAADGCAVDGDITLFMPTSNLVRDAARIMRAAHADVAGVEYIIDAASGRPTFFDFNPYSNFLSGRDDELGFNPIDRYLDYVLAAGHN